MGGDVAKGKARVGLPEAGSWAKLAHIPGWQRDPHCEVVAMGDVQAERARDFVQQPCWIELPLER